MADDTTTPGNRDDSGLSGGAGESGNFGDSGNSANSGNEDGLHFNDADLDAAMADFEREFDQSQASQNQDSQGPDSGFGQDDTLFAGDNTGESTDQPETQQSIEASFDDELQGLLGNKAKAAAIITRLTSAELLAAFCQLSDISAVCIDDPQGAVAVLRNLDGDSPEAAAKDLTTVVSGMPAILTVNRADKLEATLFLQGQAGEQFAPPILFASAAPFVEDLMLGITPLEDILSDRKSFDSADLDHDGALAVLAKHTRFGRGNSSIS